MAEPITLKYRAFLSYAHADTAWAKRLHRRLENFRIDKDLVGRATAQGAVPATLRPIFRDRDDFTAGHTLTDQTIAALDASAALIVLCSPASAKSHYVNEEIRLFKARHPERPVIPVIIDGTPGDAERECFAPALRFVVSADGKVTDTPDDELAADVRESGDGFDLAVAKVVARLLDRSTDDVFRRAERARRRSANIRNAIIAALALLAVAATGSAAYALQQLKTNDAFLEATLRRATDIVTTAVAQAEKYNVPRTATLELLTRAEGLFDDMARLGRPTPALQRQKALMLIEFARNYEILGDTTKQRERAEEAHRIMVALAADRGDDPTVLRDLSVSYDERGDVLVAQGNLPEALASYRASLAIADRLAKADPGNANWQRDLAVSYNKIGDVLVAQGNLPEALQSYQASLAIADRLAKANPGNTVWQRDLSLSYERVGNGLVAQRNLPEALTSYQASLAIRERLAKADPGNAGWQRDLAVSYNKVGDVLVAQGNPPEALTSYQASLAIAERLAKTDPGNAGWQRDLSISYDRVGNGLVAQGNLPEALKSYRASLAIRDRLARADPGNTGWQRDLSISHGKIGDVLAAQGNLPEALKSDQANLAIMERLAKADPGNAGWQRDVAASHSRLALLYLKTGERERAFGELKQGREIMQRLVTRSPGNPGWKKDLEWFDGRIAALNM
jgi:tetratricopeptide (TPR) repeat protein